MQLDPLRHNITTRYQNNGIQNMAKEGHSDPTSLIIQIHRNFQRQDYKRDIRRRIQTIQESLILGDKEGRQIISD